MKHATELLAKQCDVLAFGGTVRAVVMHGLPVTQCTALAGRLAIKNLTCVGKALASIALHQR
eukprot:5495679-Karenia_brevis.AAC.1